VIFKVCASLAPPAKHIVGLGDVRWAIRLLAIVEYSQY
jgi:hypothetical protein